MKVIVHPGDRDGGSAKYRLVWPAQELQKDGHDVEILYSLPYRTAQYESIYGYDQPFRLEGEVRGDVIIFQRPLDRRFYDTMKLLQGQGRAVVIEIDDAFHALPLHNRVRESADLFRNPNHNYKWLEKMCAEADMVTCTTKALADHYAPHGRVAILPNYVPAWYTKVIRPKRRSKPVIGWTGTLQTHTGDLNVTKGAVGRVINDSPATLAVVGTGIGVAAALQSVEPKACGWVPISRYPLEMAKFDIGIVPLALTRFNAGKSYLKTVENASLGVACVSSPTPDNQIAADLGLCQLAHNPDEWYELLIDLVGDHKRREEFGMTARRIVIDKLTIEKNAYRWADAWAEALEHRRTFV